MADNEQPKDYQQALADKLKEPGVTLSFAPDARDVALSLGVTPEVIRGVLYAADRREVAPQTAEAGYLISRHRRGDVILVVGHRDAPALRLLAVYVLTDQQSSRSYAASAGAGSGSSAPTSYRDLAARIQQRGGYRIVPGGSGHPKVIAADDGAMICTLSTTPSDSRTHLNQWRAFLRGAAAHEAAARFPATG